MGRVVGIEYPANRRGHLQGLGFGIDRNLPVQVDRVVRLIDSLPGHLAPLARLERIESGALRPAQRSLVIKFLGYPVPPLLVPAGEGRLALPLPYPILKVFRLIALVGPLLAGRGDHGGLLVGGFLHLPAVLRRLAGLGMRRAASLEGEPSPDVQNLGRGSVGYRLDGGHVEREIRRGLLVGRQVETVGTKYGRFQTGVVGMFLQFDSLPLDLPSADPLRKFVRKGDDLLVVESLHPLAADLEVEASEVTHVQNAYFTVFGFLRHQLLRNFLSNVVG